MLRAKLNAGPLLRSPTLWLGVVAVWFAVGQVALVPLDLMLSWDESVYTSQFANGVSRVEMSPHRAVGIPLALAPVAAITPSVVAIRAYLTVLTSVCLFLAYRSWVPIDRRVAPVAALLFATTGLALSHGHLAMPNLLTALAAIAAVAYFLRVAEEIDGWPGVVGASAALGVMAIVRPTDAVFLAAVLGVGWLVVPRWRRLRPFVAVVAGLAIGGLSWVVVAVVRFGGPLQRLAAMSETADVGVDPLAVTWFEEAAETFGASPWRTAASTLAALVAVAVAVVVTRRVCGRWPRARWLLTAAAAVFVIAPYYLLLAYAAHRYHLTTYGLFAVVVAAAVVRLWLVWAESARRVGTALVVLLVAGASVWQVYDAVGTGRYLTANRQERELFAQRIADRGIQPPCLVSGFQAPAFAYKLRCAAGDNMTSLPNLTGWRDEFHRDWPRARRDGLAFAVVQEGHEAPDRLTGWPRIRLGTEGDIPLYAYFPPGQ